jgi:hypothetical protein
MGLGGVGKVDLREARERARQYRELVEQGIDPVDHRERGIAAAKTAMTFRKAALAYINGKKSGWTASYAQQWVVHFEAQSSSSSGLRWLWLQRLHVRVMEHCVRADRIFQNVVTTASVVVHSARATRAR